jgi:hypothetical protein
VTSAGLLTVLWAVFAFCVWFGLRNRKTSNKRRTGAWWRLIARRIRHYEERWTLPAWLGLDSREGWFVLLRTFFLLLLLASIASCPAWLFLNCLLPFVVAIVVAFILVDAIVANTSVVFLTQNPVNPLRSAVLTTATYFNLSQGFAVGWLPLGSADGSSWERIVSAMHQSIRTVTTAGPDGAITTAAARHLVIIEMAIGIYFVTIVLAVYASWAQTARRARR